MRFWSHLQGVECLQGCVRTSGSILTDRCRDVCRVVVNTGWHHTTRRTLANQSCVVSTRTWMEALSIATCWPPLTENFDSEKPPISVSYFSPSRGIFRKLRSNTLTTTETQRQESLPGYESKIRTGPSYKSIYLFAVFKFGSLGYIFF
jgi:hypothetical protein